MAKTKRTAEKWTKYNLTNEAFHDDPKKEYNKHKHVVIGEVDNICQFRNRMFFIERHQESVAWIEKFDCQHFRKNFHISRLGKLQKQNTSL